MPPAAEPLPRDPAPAAIERLGRCTLDLSDGALRLSFDGVEVIRQIGCPIRDADWRTVPVIETTSERHRTGDTLRLDRRFQTVDGTIDGRLSVVASTAGLTGGLTAELTLTARRDVRVNRAGFVLLHPIAGVAGTALTVRHSDGSTETTRFPDLISPGQPVFDIAGLRHRIAGVDVTITMEGETFEMEDQRNWTDASFKTYCRPLARPRPYTLAAGDVVRQRLRIDVSGAADRPPASVSMATEARIPAILLAHDAALADHPGPVDLASLGVSGLLLRVDAAAPELSRPIDAPVTLEIVADHAGEITSLASRCAAEGLRPRRVIALPRSYLASHQPEGPWPTPTPADFIAAARAAFPGAGIGGGALTNFTEFNRCPPDPAAIDFASFGTTAIVHAADDRAVCESLEALAAIFASAQALARDRPLHLGLVAIAMRSNPYGSAVAENPDHLRLPMASDDPRQRTRFAAAWTIGAVAEAARAGVASLAPAMTSGPIALGGSDAAWPIRDAVAALAALSGKRVRIEGAPGGLIVLTAPGRTIAANLGDAPASISGHDLAPIDLAIFGDPA